MAFCLVENTKAYLKSLPLRLSATLSSGNFEQIQVKLKFKWTSNSGGQGDDLSYLF